MFNIKWYDKVVLLGNLICYLLYLLSGFATIINPASVPFIPFFGLAFNILLLINLVFIAYWTIRKKIYSFVFFCLLLIHYKPLQAIFSFGKIINTESPGSISIMTYNVKNFDLYDWNKTNDTRKQMMQLIREERPSIICMQEFYSSDSKSNQYNEKYLSDSLGYAYHYFEKMLTVNENESWGLAIFSRLPIINKGRINFNNARINGAIYTDLVFENDTFRVYNAHLQSFHFAKEDYDLVENEEKIDQQNYRKILQLYNRMTKAFSKRSLQAENLKFYMNESPYSNILVGDFNDSPTSYSYNTLQKDMQDAFVKCGYGFGRTFINPRFSFRIDYCLFDLSFDVNSYKAIEKGLSDHYPVVTTFSLKK